MKAIISSDAAPKAIGPYSQAVSSNGFLFVSGQLPIDPKTGTITALDITGQTQQSLLNIQAILAHVGLELADIVKTTVFLSSMDDFSAMNGVYQTFFTEQCPARSAVEVARLPKDALVEIEAICAK